MGGGYNTQFESFGHALDDRLASRSISLSVSIPLYNGGTLKNKYRISRIQMQKLEEQREYEKAVATVDIVRDLYNINIIIESINNYRATLRLLNTQMTNVKLAMDYGRINMEQYIRLKSQYSQSYMTYLALIKSYYIYVYTSIDILHCLTLNQMKNYKRMAIILSDKFNFINNKANERLKSFEVVHTYLGQQRV